MLKGKFKIVVTDLNDKNREIINEEVDHLAFDMNRPLEPTYKPGKMEPTGFKQTGPTVWVINLESHKAQEEFNKDEKNG